MNLVDSRSATKRIPWHNDSFLRSSRTTPHPYQGWMDAYRKVAVNLVDILTNPRHSKWISACLVSAEAVLGALIIWRVQCALPLVPLLNK